MFSPFFVLVFFEQLSFSDATTQHIIILGQFSIISWTRRGLTSEQDFIYFFFRFSFFFYFGKNA